MAIICEAPGLWDQIVGSPAFMSRQQWQATNILILCQLVVDNGGNPDMSDCEIDGLWNQVKGNPPYMSDQEFYALNVKLLCLLAGGGGGGGFGSGVLINRPSPTGTFGFDEPPPDAPTKVTDLSFLDESAGLRWQPDALHVDGGYWIGYQ